ncbi:putative aliphatic sulfonates-binding protein precursor [Variibacter gotjawalensis]|uniref:Putative aliphatic sulfonates-binding protein n=1 Tax=Variibacter gotjawalensis TaxID=1333996 RepID=A0A0S3PS87_9BRAD|nr:ABC transporter substrate-binding protein [Variibacter gotjawalensis]NIK49120.1 NitT/TauT family transport system substrate-binding protein [Variibacter gotjawalensis]RZS50976.1 NitT/TauT family transport system substrate-binding protein [Variibacter gotjawalensis]BAT58810.1 putative aliphatic sulfonates-binding protein precursor [Variibacter gotjawalensis]
MTITRRDVLQSTAALAAASALPMPAIAQAKEKIRVGYLHTLAVDGQMWLADHLGAWSKHGLEPDFKQFTTGLELFQAMVGGSLDMLSTGAVISNFPARGQGKMFMANAVEFATAQLWVREDQGIKTFADLKGKRIATTTGTTAHVFLDTALRANGINPSDVDIVNQRMTEAVTSFISGAVPAVALWVPFNIPVRDKTPGAKKLVDASAYYPKAAIISGWAASNDFHAKKKDVLARVVKAWGEGNDMLLGKTDEALAFLQQKHYPQVPIADIKEQYQGQKVFSNADWSKMFADGTVTGWLQQVTDFYVGFAKISNAVPAKDYFDPSIYIAAMKG